MISTMTIATLLLIGCNPQPAGIKIKVSNPTTLSRKGEVVQIDLTHFAGIPEDSIPQQLIALYKGDTLTSQIIDTDSDGRFDLLLVQTDLPGMSSIEITLAISESESTTNPDRRTFCKFIPERIDDFAWENDKVAFRTYGPTAQKIVEDGKPGGTLSSGIDCWLKKVEYPVIEKWYAKNLVEPGYYHVDHGEGYDPYHVGTSRGCGGIGFLDGDSLFVSKNFTSYKIITNGPLRSVFELSYAPYFNGSELVSERKVITIDRGSNMAKVEVHLSKRIKAKPATIGLTLHDLKGEPKIDSGNGIFRYWEKIDDAFLGTAIVVLSTQPVQGRIHKSGKKDQSHIYVSYTTPQNSLTYFCGLGWSKAGEFETALDWDKYLENFKLRIENPVQVQSIQ
jgi:hypothetical protein